MIRNGLYLAETTFLDGVDAYNRHVMVLRDGTMRGGGGYYYTVGSYTCSGGKWKGEMTSREHSPISVTYPWARKISASGLPERIAMTVPSSKQPRWPASDPIDSSRFTACCSQIEGSRRHVDCRRESQATCGAADSSIDV